MLYPMLFVTQYLPWHCIGSWWPWSSAPAASGGVWRYQTRKEAVLHYSIRHGQGDKQTQEGECTYSLPCTHVDGKGHHLSWYALLQELEAAKQRNEDLESQFIQHGKELLAQSKPQSLAAEMETASKDEVSNQMYYYYIGWCKVSRGEPSLTA